MTSETYLDLTFERSSSKSLTANAGGGSGVTSSAGGGISGGSEKRPIRPKLLKLSDVTIPHRNRKKTKTKSKDRSGNSVRDRIYDDPAYTDDISHLANPIRRNSVNLLNSELLSVSNTSGGGKYNISGSSSLGKRSKLTKEFKKLAQEDIGHIAFSSSEEDLRYQRAVSARPEAIGRGRSLERSNAIIVEPNEKPEIKRRTEKRNNKQKRNLSLDNKRQHSQQELKEINAIERDRAPEPPQRLALTRHNLGKQRSDEASWQRQQSQLDFPLNQPDNEDVFSLHSSAKENMSVTASTSASLSNASTSKIQMGKRFLKGEIGIKSFNYYLLKEGLKSSKKFVEKQKSNFQSSTNNTLATLTSSSAADNTSSLPLGKSKIPANSEENIYEEIFFKEAPASEEDDENQNPSKSHKQLVGASACSATSAEQTVMYTDCEFCMQQCDKADCEYCFQPELPGMLNQNRTFNNANIKAANNGSRLNSGNLNNNVSSRTAMENQVNSAPILEFQSYNPNNPGVYKIETTPVAITGDYNPILQFQQPSTQPQPPPQPQQQKQTHAQHQSTSTTSTATTTPSDHHLQHQHHLQVQQQQQQHQSHHSLTQQQNQQHQFYGYKQPTFYTPHTKTGLWSQTSSVPRPRAYMVTNHLPTGVSSMQRMNTKSSSSSDSLQQHKFNTFTNLDPNFFNGSHVTPGTGSAAVNNSYLPPQPLQPLMYAASRRLGGSQILVDHSNTMFENPPQIYKSDSRASILSEYSLSRSSDTYYGSQRFGHNRHYGTSYLNDHHNFENSLMSSYATGTQRRYYGSAESCRFGYDCRRCSLDSGPGAGLLATPRINNATTCNSTGNAKGMGEKCTFSDHCKYDCRNCDCSSVYFSSDFDDIYSGGGIPRKTAKGTLPSTGGQPPPPALDSYEMTASNEKQQALKQNKYAQDFFKHVNDVKRSIYQAEMQRNGNVEPMSSPKKSAKKEIQLRESEREISGITTLPLAKERTTKPTPAPRPSLQQQIQTSEQTTPQPLQRKLAPKNNEPCLERKEYASLDRLIAANKGAIPKNTNNSNKRLSPHSSPKMRASTREANEGKTNGQMETVASEQKRHVKKHFKETSKITSSSLASSLSGHRRKDIPAAPPPSPATYADLQELQQNMQNTMRDDTKQEKERKRKRKQHENGEHDKQQQESATTITKNEGEQEQRTSEVSLQQQPSDTKTTTKDSKTIDEHKVANIVNSNLITKDATDNRTAATNNKIILLCPDSKASTANKTSINTANVTDARVIIPEELQSMNSNTNEEKSMLASAPEEEQTTVSSPCTAQTQTSNSFMAVDSLTSVSSSIVTAAMDLQQRDQTETYDDDVFYDARSEDSACNAASSSMASNAQLKMEQRQEQQQQSCTETKCQQSENHQQQQHQQLEQHLQKLEVSQEEHFKNLSLHLQETIDEDPRKKPVGNLEAEGKPENEQQRQQHQYQEQPHCQPQTLPTADCHKINEALQSEQQMNKTEVEKKNNDIENVNQSQNEDKSVTPKVQEETQQQCTDISSNLFVLKSDIGHSYPTSAKDATIAAAGNVAAIAVPALDFKVNKQIAKKQETNELQTSNNDEGNTITKGNDKTNKSDKREAKRFSKYKRDYVNEEEKRENKSSRQQQQKADDEKLTTTTTNATNKSTTATATKKTRTQRRSPSSSSNATHIRGGADQTASPKVTISTLSCDTCCQLEWFQQHNTLNSSPLQQQHSPQTLKPPTLHIGMAGQPARVSKRKNSSSGSTSRERATKTKEKEIKTKIIYSQEKPESTTTKPPKTKTASRETGISSSTATKINKTKETETETETEKKSKTKSPTQTEREKELATCSAAIESTNVAETRPDEAELPAQEQLMKEHRNVNEMYMEPAEITPENPDISQEFKQISEAIASLQHNAETSDSLTLQPEPTPKEQHESAAKNVDSKLAEQLNSTEKIPTNNTEGIEDKAAAAAAATAGAATTAADAGNVAAEVAVSTEMVDQQTAKEAVNADDGDAAAAAEPATTTTTTTTSTATVATATANDSKTNTTNISCNSEFAGVTTHSPHNSSSAIVPLIITLQSSVESDTRRPPLQRQDYSCLDSSEAQSDDSHLTRDSITRESQNDELSSSTLDKIDVCSLPLPALPPKKRRTKLRASPSRHHHGRSRHDSPQKQLQPLQDLRDPQSGHASSTLDVEDNKHLSAFQQYVAKRRESLEASSRSFNEKLESRKMHYHMGGGGGGGPAGNSSTSGNAGIHMPTYLFGEQYFTGGFTSPTNRKSMGPSSKEEIYLNKSGWVQVNTKRANNENRGYRRNNYNHQNGDLRNTIRVIQIDNTRRSDRARQALLQHQHSMMEPPKFVSSKVEELIQRNEARLGNVNIRDSALRPGYRIVDPQLASILNERPGFLPVKNLNDHDSPPPITPILSPPPAFQDSSAKIKSFDRRRTVSSRPSPQHRVPQPQVILNNSNLQAVNGVNNKGMVFSRSFEYDNRRTTPTDAYVETFSRSFDGNLTERVIPTALPRDRSPNFSTLTGNSPNYLTKKDSCGGSSGSLKSRESSPKYQSPVASVSSALSPQNQKTTAYLNTSVKEAPPSYSVATGHQAQKYSPRSAHHDRLFERSKSHNVLGRSRKSQFSRSGSGSTPGVVNNMGVSRFRSFETTASQRLNSCDSGARSDLSNDELDIEEDDAGSSDFLNTNSYHPATSPFKAQRQRSLTPDRNESHSSSSSLRKQRSITPESRSLTPEDRRKKGSQVSLTGSRQNSSSRINTLERKHDKVNISRSSSSSSYSGREHDSHAHSSGMVGGGVAILENSGLRVGVVGINASSNQHRRSSGRNAKQADEHRIRRSRSLQLTERSPNRGHKMMVCVGQPHANSNQPPLYQQSNMRNNFPPTIRTTGKSQSILLSNTNGGVTGSGTRQRQSDIDKSRSFDFDYCNYNATVNSLKSQHSNSSLLGAQTALNREVALRLDFDKSRSFDEDYREAVVSNNNLNANARRYLQANENSDRNHVAIIRRSSPVEGNNRNTRSPQSSGSSCNNLNVPRSNTSPQNYGTRLCDHEMTYDLMRKSLDRSPIMDFRRGDSAGTGGDYDIPMSLLRNRETINSGGNSELNFMNSDSRQYEHMSSNSLKQQRSLRRTHSPNESHYSLERSHNAGSRDDITAIEPNEYRKEFNDIYRRTRSNNRGSGLFKSITTTNLPLNTTTNTTTITLPRTKEQQQQKEEHLLENCLQQPCSYWPQCGACQNLEQPNYEYLKSLPLKRKSSQNVHRVPARGGPANAPPTPGKTNNDALSGGKSLTQLNVNVSTVQINIDTNINLDNSHISLQATNDQPATMTRRPPKSTSQWTLLCKNAVVPSPTATTKMSHQNMTCLEVKSAARANTVVNVKTFPLVTAETPTATVTTTTTATTKTTPIAPVYTTALKTTLSANTAPTLPTSSSSPSLVPATPKITEFSYDEPPRVIPLAATSLVFLGDFEMPITRNGNSNGKDICVTQPFSFPTPTERQNDVSAFAAKIHADMKKLCATENNDTQPGTLQTNKFKDKTSSTIRLNKIMENGAKDCRMPSSCTSSSSCSSSSSNCCLESSLASSSSSGSTNHFCPSNTLTKTSAAVLKTDSGRKRKNIKIRAGRNQRYRRRPRMSLPNIWLSLAEQEAQNESIENQQQRYTRTTTTNDGVSVIGIRNGFLTNLSHQIRAVSSPSLTTDATATAAAANAILGDNNALVHQRVPSSNSSYTTTSHEDSQTTSNHNTAAATTSASSTCSTATAVAPTQNVGVLQKFKRTLTNFSKHQQQPAAPNQTAASSTTTTGTTTVGAKKGAADSTAFIITDTEMQTDVTDGCSSAGAAASNKYRFGPLVWRTSKERRKTKYNRRDKCNSGDSGIQIELENDEHFARVLSSGSGGMQSSATNGSLFNRNQDGMSSLKVRTVRRTNSAKVTSIMDETAAAKQHSTKPNVLQRLDINSEREAPESLPTRSLSQPNGLESCGMTRTDLDDSDSDSVTSHEEGSSYFPIYAEVLYNFTAAGPQELGLEKGTLLEILRKEIGPWWFGRIKKEDASLVEEILDPELGWFPKEFVRVIHSPETDFFYLQHMAEQQHQQQLHSQHQKNETSQLIQEYNENVQQGNHLLNTSSSAPCALANSSMEDNCNTTVIDQHNVTTIVIESSSSPSSSSTPHLLGIDNNATNDATAKDLTLSAGNNTHAVLSTSQSLNVIMDSADILRRSAVKELLDTEVNYVKLLSAICEGYLPAMSKRIDIFSPNSIRLIFSNITAIYKFQRKFLDALRKAIEQNQVAKVFLKMHKGFLCYSTYCNAYPRALIELASYERVKDARTILDNCRELENLAELPLSAHLLAPVQRICRYPLHLGEMIKSSAKGAEPPAFSLAEFEQIDVSQLDIPDTTETVDMALEAMKSVTEAVNEGKRHSETIARHQASFQNFKGPPLHLHSTRFFVQIDATRQKQNLWNSSCTLFLFDNQLVYCKRDIIKRSNFIYKGRIFLDRCRVVNVRDGKMFGHTIKNSLRIYCEARDKWFDFSFRSANRKHRFLNTLALERQFGGKSLYISEMTGFEYAFEERDYSDQSDYEGGDNGEQKIKEYLYESHATTGNNTNTSGESSVPESPAKSFKYSDTLPLKKPQRADSTAAGTAAVQGSENQTGSLGRRRLGNWFRKPKSTASTPNHSPTHKPTQTAHSTGDLQLTGTDAAEIYSGLEHSENGGGVSS